MDASRLLPLLLLLGGCSGNGCGDKPYVPYSIDDEGKDAAPLAPAAQDAAASAVEPDKASASREAPADASEWTVGELSMRAPEGKVFQRALFRDFDGDGKDDALAVVRAHQGVEAAVVFFASRAAAGEAATVVLPSAKLQGDDSCSVSSSVEPAGSLGAVVDIHLICAGHTAETAARRLAFLAFRQGAMKVRASAEVADPPEVLQIAGSDTDRDADGQADVTLVFRGVRAGSKTRPLSVVWLDRPAGLSRDLAEPEASLVKLAQEADAKAKRPKDARAAVDLAADVGALAHILCGPRPRVKFDFPTLSCGEGRALERASLAKVRAYATQKAPHFTLPAYEETRGFSAAIVKEAEKLALGSVTAVQAASVHVLRALPEALPDAAPAFGALTFEPDGNLIVKARDAIVRVDTPTLEENQAPGVRYFSTVASPDGGYSWLEAFDPCDGAGLHVTLSPVTVGDVVDVTLPVASALRSCAGKGLPKRGVPLSWTQGALEVLVEGWPLRIDVTRATAELTLPRNGSGPPGSASSPDGKIYVLPTSLGVLVVGKDKLVTHAELGNPRELRGCTVSNDGRMIACSKGEKAVLVKID